jgi:uncharacterized DUF497 family protein
VRIEALHIDDAILEKIESMHGVSLREVEEACYSHRLHVRRGRAGLYKVFSLSEAGRYLLVVLADRRAGVWQIVTARSMTHTERRLYRRWLGE